MKKKTIKLKYPTLDSFSKHYHLIKKGKLFIPSASPSPIDTELLINISLQGTERVYSTAGVVVKVFVKHGGIDTRGVADQTVEDKKTQGMLISLTGGLEKLLAELEEVMGAGDKSGEASNGPIESADEETTETTEPLTADPVPADELPESVPEDSSPQEEGVAEDAAAEVKSKPKLSLDWLRKAVSREIAEMEVEVDEETEQVHTPRKGKLSLEDQKIVKPACEFVMDLAKAMSRSGYYDPDHPGSIDAKQGLHESLTKSLGSAEEIMITMEGESLEKVDMYLSGILDEPVNIREVVGEGVAELFVPKLREYFRRKDLVSLTIKKSILAEHFNKFVDIMNDPITEQKKGADIGEFLTNALIKHGISDISTVYNNDLVELDSDLPWQTEMAVQRLVKDLKVLPKIRGDSEEEMRAMTEKLVRDIVKPMKNNPQMLKDMALSCESISTNVDNPAAGEICVTVAESLPEQMLLPTSKLIFDDLKKILQEIREHQENPDSDPEAVANLNRRQASAERMLKQTSRRVLAEKSPKANKFIEEMYNNNIVSYDELPREVQYNVDTSTMVNDIRSNIGAYLDGVLTAKTEEETEIYMKCIQRAVPQLFENGDWPLLFKIMNAGDKSTGDAKDKGKKDGDDTTAAEQEIAIDKGPPANPFVPFFYDYIDRLTVAYTEVETEERRFVDGIVRHMGPMGIEILNRIMAECQDFGVQQSASDSLLKMGDLAGNWVYEALNDPSQPGHVQKSALKIMGYIGKSDEDLHKVRRFLINPDPELRSEALVSMLRLKARDSEALVVRANNDKDKRVRKVALSSLKKFSPLSDVSFSKLLKIVKEKQPEEREEVVEHARKVAMLLRAISVLASSVDYNRIEDVLIELVQQLTEQKGFLSFLRRSADKEQTILLNAAIEVFEKIGSAKAVATIESLTGDDNPLAEKARKAINRINQRLAE